MSIPDSQQRIYELLQHVSTEGLSAIKRLFWTELNYERVNDALSTRDWPDGTRDLLIEDPVLLAQNKAQAMGAFNVIYVRLTNAQQGRGFPLSLAAERLVIKQLSSDHPYALFLFSDTDERHWHLVNVKLERRQAEAGEGRAIQPVLRRIALGPEERLRTAAERISLLDLDSISRDLFGLSAMAIQQRHDEAFDVEAVTGQFFKRYKQVFTALQTDLRQQTGDAQWAHDYALQFLNRLMFLYYVQRKRWLGQDPEFLTTFWVAYQRAQRNPDTFVGEWLNVLFFEAFNKRFQAGRSEVQYLPDKIREALALAPYLNGGLFLSNELDWKYEPIITDALFKQLFNFLEHYNFTISEDTPLDQEVAVDPEMIGKVYESLVNVSDNIDERGDAGIFYTPRVEIDLMCRLSLVNWLSNHLGSDLKSLLYEIVFALDPEEKVQADATAAERNLWPQLNELLRRITVLDPSCGSGSFLVGMLYVLDDLLARAASQLGIEETPYERKRRAIGQSLYGVDVMDWAVHVAELRLWLQLVIDTDLEPAELQFRPLLPNLSFRVRQGDSLVQEVGGINLALRKGNTSIPSSIKGRITQLKGEKLKFYHNEPQRKYQTAQQLHLAELGLFRDLLEARVKALDERQIELEQALQPQVNLFGEVQTKQLGLDQVQLEEEVEALQAERERLVPALNALRTVKDVPFVWDIAFVEVFSGERPGFDVVIGNPPYVRQELIRDPRIDSEEVTAADKRAYKDKLARAVYTAWPQTFGYDWSKGQPRWKLNAKSDLYIYFYFYGLSLLNERGIFCFITSNSWLDVGYGRDLQEFLLTRGDVRLVLDNQARRSFASADVNTVIVLLGAARDGRRERAEALQRVARFVMFRAPYELALNARVWQWVEERQQRQLNEDCRAFPLTQGTLHRSGIDSESKKYAGEKWGGKLLRAPDIYWEILERHKDKLVRLGDIAEVRFGIKTGANEFFYLDHDAVESWQIEPEFLRPAIKSSRQCKTVWVSIQAEGELSLFLCHKSREELAGTQALRYIEFGEKQGFHRRPSCRSRARWWDLGEKSGARVNCNYLVDRVMRFFIGSRPFLVSDNFHEIHSELDSVALAAACNSTLAQLEININGRSNFGDGLLKIQTYEVANLFVPKPQLLSGESLSQILRDAYTLELDGYDRLQLDTLVFDALGFSVSEREAVLEATQELVRLRLEKAGSL